MTSIRRIKLVSYAIASLAGLYSIDRFWNCSSFIRSLRTLLVAGSVAVDYKWNFTSSRSRLFSSNGDSTSRFSKLAPNLNDGCASLSSNDHIERLHTRTAHKIYNLCRSNGGLYINASIPVLPPAYITLFKQLYDQAPSHEYEAPIEEVFSHFEPVPVASASIAQVHKGILRKNGLNVAVKIQKPEIQTQMGFDLLMYQIISYLAEKCFGLPGIYKNSQYVAKNMRQEADFINEAKNSETCQAYLLESSSSLRDHVYVPKVDWDLTTKVIMTQEWIEGISLVRPNVLFEKKYNVDEIMTTVVELFADQIFRTGFVHCDPHPGNIIIRELESDPNAKRNPQIVLIDHGLYIQSSETFRRQYCQFWVGMFTFDFEALDSVARAWGIPDISLFATATLAKPWRRDQTQPTQVRNQSRLSDAFAAHQQGKDRLVEFLQSMDRMPQELMFIGRNMNIVRANNKALGSPVNRINIMAESAAKSIALIPSTAQSQSISYLTLATSRWNLLKFQAVLFLGTVTFYFLNFMSRVRRFFGWKDDGFEGLLDDQLKQTLQQEFPGFVIDDSVFDS